MDGADELYGGSVVADDCDVLKYQVLLGAMDMSFVWGSGLTLYSVCGLVILIRCSRCYPLT